MNHIPKFRHLAIAMKSICVPAFVAILTLSSCGPDTDPRVSNTAPVVYQYAIKGMHCQDCVNAITDKAVHTDGVVDCRVNLKENSAMIAMRDDAVEPQVKSGIEKLGFTVTIIPSAAATGASMSSPATTSATAQPK
ncbi:MAG: heavy-metal-associated domain-containing protein [Phycisphaerales bacterium]|nr:heavy-metal-associated domain-containing protein [Phycisphaerales bacterium]